jgi:hypothetical protein
MVYRDSEDTNGICLGIFEKGKTEMGKWSSFWSTDVACFQFKVKNMNEMKRLFSMHEINSARRVVLLEEP